MHSLDAFAQGKLDALDAAALRRRLVPTVRGPEAAADAMRLPFADGSFDVVTMSFGLRNVADTEVALGEFLRVTRPGGRLVVCEFSHPTNGAFRTVYSRYLMRSLPAIARWVSSDPESYVYLAETIQEWPAQRELAERVAAAGWEGVQWRNLSGGVVALHRATRPAVPAVEG